MATNLDRIKATLKRGGFLRRYLEESGREILSGGQLRCPDAAAHNNGDKKPSAHLYEDADGERVKCFGCGESWDILGLYMKDNGVEFMAALEALATRFGLDDGSKRKPVAKAVPVVASASAATTPGRDEKAEAFLAECAARISATDYFERRGISAATAKRLGCGFDPAHYFPALHERREAVIFPASKGWAARSVEGKEHNFTKGIKDGSAFNLGAVKSATEREPLYIVEGQFDALSLEEIGAHAIALGGVQHVEEVVEALRKVRPAAPVVVALDYEDDEKKRAAVAKARARLEKGIREAGAYVYHVDGDNVFGAHDANDALLEDPKKFKDEVRRLSWLASEAYVLRNETPAKMKEPLEEFVRTFADIGEPIPEDQNPDAIIKGGYLRRGQVLTIVSCAGVGKSVFTNQLAISLAAGRACFLPEPVRPLSVLVLQTEDDEYDMREFMHDYKAGFKRLGWSDEEIKRALAGVQWLDVREYRRRFPGSPLVDDDIALAIEKLQRSRRRDVVILNPLTSFLSEYDLSDNCDATKFFRQKLSPVVENPDTKCALVLIHHTGKAPKDAKAREGFMRGAYAQYDAKGASSLMDWTRASLMIAPTESERDFVLHGSKRKERLGWRDGEGRKTYDKYISYSPDIVFWIPTPPDRLAKLLENSKGKSSAAVDPKTDAATFAATLRSLDTGITATEARQKAQQQFGQARGNAAFDEIAKAPESFNVAYQKLGRSQYYGGLGALTMNGDDEPPPVEGIDDGFDL